MERKNLSKRLRVREAPGVVFGDVVYAPAAGFGPRWQADYQLVLVLSGGLRVAIDGRERPVAAGEVCLLRPGHEERFFWDERTRTRHTWCAVSPAVVAADADLPAKLAAAPVRRVIPARLAQVMELAFGVAPGLAGHEPGLLAAMGRLALHTYAAAEVTLLTAAGSTEPVARLLDWLDEHLAEPVDLPTLAKVAGVSRAQLVRVCRRDLGETPLRWVWRRRTARGVQLLRDTGLPVGEIAWRCGFQTPFHFSRWVRHCEGVSPRQIRRSAWRGPGADKGRSGAEHGST
jgi:AraC-like DNA-binding protein/quercetin dioxygenase-like cupin family protein